MKDDFLRNLSSRFVIRVPVPRPTFLPFIHAWIILGFKQFLSLSFSLSLSLIVIVASSRSWKDNYKGEMFFFLSLCYINEAKLMFFFPV